MTGSRIDKFDSIIRELQSLRRAEYNDSRNIWKERFDFLENQLRCTVQKSSDLYEVAKTKPFDIDTVVKEAALKANIESVSFINLTLEYIK